MTGTDWVAWHEAYEDPGSPLAVRLGIVQGHLRGALDVSAPGSVQVLSLCAGEGRDLIGVLQDHPRRDDVRACLVELDATLADRAREAIRAVDLHQVEVRTADAGLVDGFADAVPAALVVACGIFGNITDEDIHRTIAAMPQLCAPDATVIWTRHRRPPDVTPTIRAWFVEAGFEDVAFDAPEERPGLEASSRWRWTGVGVARFGGPTVPLVPHQRLFRFVS